MALALDFEVALCACLRCLQAIFFCAGAWGGCRTAATKGVLAALCLCGVHTLVPVTPTCGDPTIQVAGRGELVVVAPWHLALVCYYELE
jgi:hypothetical protein